MRKIKIGVLGGYRGSSMINYCKRADNAEVVAICDKLPEVLEQQRKAAEGLDITYYDNFEDFIQHDMDAVVLANYANEHAPFAIKAMKAGKHVFSEVLPVQCMKEAVELIETVEATGMTYAYAENYCYMPAPYEMKVLYQQGKIGEFEYGECEYIHNCESIWPSITYGDKTHWRNNMYSTFYCTHSLGPIIHATGLRPVSVTGFESTLNARNFATGARGANMGIEMVRLENGGLVKSIHGGLYENSIWYSMYGSKGRMESAREDADNDKYHRIYVKCDKHAGAYENLPVKSYMPRENDERVRGVSHGGSDFYSIWHFVEKLLGNPEADTIDVYEALDMCMCGMFAYRSILAGGIPMEIPNLRDKAARDAWREDVACCDPKVAGDKLLPTCASGTPDIPDEVYAHMKKLYELECAKPNGGDYRAKAFNQGNKKEKAKGDLI